VENSAQDTKFHEDNDSLYRMPMKIVPMETAMLRRGRLIKNAALDPAIELFRSGENGSGQMLLGTTCLVGPETKTTPI